MNRYIPLIGRTMLGVALVTGCATSSHNPTANHTASHSTTVQSQPAKAKTTNTAPTSGKLPTQNHIQSVSIAVGSTKWTTQDTTTVGTQVLSWLKSSTTYKGNIPTGVTNLVRYVPLTLLMTSGDVTISISPAYYFEQTKRGKDQIHFVKNVITYEHGNSGTYLTSPQLYTWLKSNQWKTEFAPSTLYPVPSYIDPQGHNLTMTAQMVGLTNVYVPSQIQGAGNLVNIGGDASLKTLSITFSHLNINESTQPLTGGGIVNKENAVTLTDGVTAQWMTVTGHANTMWLLELKTGSVYMSLASTDNALSKNQVEHIASSIVPIQP